MSSSRFKIESLDDRALGDSPSSRESEYLADSVSVLLNAPLVGVPAAQEEVDGSQPKHRHDAVDKHVVGKEIPEAKKVLGLWHRQ